MDTHPHQALKVLPLTSAYRLHHWREDECLFAFSRTFYHSDYPHVERCENEMMLKTESVCCTIAKLMNLNEHFFNQN